MKIDLRQIPGHSAHSGGGPAGGQREQERQTENDAKGGRNHPLMILLNTHSCKRIVHSVKAHEKFARNQSRGGV